MAQHPPSDRKKFHCREWTFQKVAHCLDQRPTSKSCGALILGGPGSGKTTLCTELCWPSQGPAARQQRSLNRRLLAHHFLQGHHESTLALSEFVRHLATQILNHSTESYRQRRPHDPMPAPNTATALRTQLADAYLAKLKSDPEMQLALRARNIEARPDECLKRGLLFPLLEIDPPRIPLFILIDSIDEHSFVYTNSTLSRGTGTSSPNQSRTIAELLANHHHLFPQWLLLVCTARKQSKTISRMFAGFRKIILDDLRKSQVVRDVQQYILARLDQETNLRRHISRDTAEMLNQLHIKSNGCFLYLEKVLDGVGEGFIVLREIRDIPGTLNGLYLWLCQRLFSRRPFNKVQLLLNVILAAKCSITERVLYDIVSITHAHIGRDDFRKRFHLLRRIVTVAPSTGVLQLFHHSFAEWLLDVKHCTQKYLCNIHQGHAMLAVFYTVRAKDMVVNQEIYDFAYHLTRMEQYIINTGEGRCGKTAAHKLTDAVNPLDSDTSSLDMHTNSILWLIMSGCPIEDCLLDGDEMAGMNFGVVLPTDPKVLNLLVAAGAIEPSSQQQSIEGAAPNAESTTEADEMGATANIPNTSENLIGGTVGAGLSLTTSSSDSSRRHSSSLLHLAHDNNDEDDDDELGNVAALHVAARLGQANVVKALLDAGTNADQADVDGWTPLRAAAWGGHTEVVELLVAHGCHLDSVDGENRTALRAASWSGHEEIVKILLGRGADVNLTDHEGRTALIAAAYMGHAEIVEHLVAVGAAAVDHADSDGRTALSVAALCAPRHTGTTVVATLIEYGATVDHQDNEGMTPLLVAAFEGHRDICELLLENEADVDHVDGGGRSPLWAAASMGHGAVVALLLFWGCCIDAMDGEGRTVLSVAAAQGSVEVVRLLLDRGLDEQHRDNSGWTPLHYAAFEGHLDICEALLEAGARIDETDNEGKAALALAAQGGHTALIHSLVCKFCAPVNQRPHDGKTALRLAALEGHVDVIRILLENGADIDAKDADGRTTLYVLALENRLAMVRMLLQAGADVESRDFEGRTPLHVSAWQGHRDMVALLLHTGKCQVDAADLANRTALHSASWQGHSTIVRLLLENGACADHTCNQGATALGIAAQEGHEACALALLEHGADPNHSDACGRNALRVAAKSGHRTVVRLLEEYNNNNNNNNNTKQLSTSRSVNSSMRTTTSLSSSPPSNVDNNHVIGVDRQLSTSAVNPTQWTKDSLVVVSSNSKSSSNLTGSSRSSGADRNDTAVESLTFTEQLQQCTRGGRTRPMSRLLQNEPQSPIYVSPPMSPVQDLSANMLSALNIYQPVLRHQNNLSQTADPHFARDTHMRIILGNNNPNSFLSNGGAAKTPPTATTNCSFFSNFVSKTEHGNNSSNNNNNNNNNAKKNDQNIGGPEKISKPKRNGIVTNPALRLVANVKNGLDSAAANLRKSALGGGGGSSSSHNNPSTKTNSFHWRKETPL